MSTSTSINSSSNNNNNSNNLNDSSFDDLGFDPDVLSTIKDKASDGATSVPMTMTSIERIRYTIDNMTSLSLPSTSMSPNHNTPPSTVCAHPLHLHSFTLIGIGINSTSSGGLGLTTLIQSRFSSCIVCNERIKLSDGGNIVRCVACGIFAHRSCTGATVKVTAMENISDGDGDGQGKEKCMPICQVNKALLQERSLYISRVHGAISAMEREGGSGIGSNCDRNCDNNERNNVNVNNDDDPEAAVLVEDEESSVRVLDDDDNNNDNAEIGNGSSDNNAKHHHQSSSSSRQQPLDKGQGQGKDENDANSRIRSAHVRRKGPKRFSSASSTSTGTGTDEDGFVWSDAGPPTHWALSSPNALEGLSPSPNSSSHSHSYGHNMAKEKTNETDNIKDEKENAWKTSFANLSRALHQNIFASQNQEQNIIRTNNVNANPNPNENPSSSSADEHDNANDASKVVVSMSQSLSAEIETAETMEHSKAVMYKVNKSLDRKEEDFKPRNGDCDGDGNVDDGNGEGNNGNDDDENINAVLYEADPAPSSPTKTQQVIQNLQCAGEIVKKTTTSRKNIGIASVAGSIAGATAGLVVAGPAGFWVGSKIGQVMGVAGVIIEGTIGVGVLAAGITGTVLTVKQLKGGENNRMLTIGNGNGDDGGKGSDCCKVVLVRPNVVVDPIWGEITNEARRCAPADRRGDGFPFFGAGLGQKQLGKKERQRRAKDIVNSEEGEINTQEKIFLLVASSLNDKSSLPGFVYRQLIQKVKNRAEEISKNDSNDEGRAIRQDVHGVIKHITATLLEVRPGFASTPRLTEISATAVETLVFGEVYNLVIDEINAETDTIDQQLNNKLSTLRQEANTDGINVDAYISDSAIESLKILPSYHSVAEKLRCCVELLEYVSKIGSSVNMGADCLLKLVCQHLVLARVPNLNAECIFLEEFARDQQLLQGKEGYALVTMQASLGFLNASQNLVEDVFIDDD